MGRSSGWVNFLSPTFYISLITLFISIVNPNPYFILRPAKNEVAKMRRIEEKVRNVTLPTAKSSFNVVEELRGPTLRTFYDHAEMRLGSLNVTANK